MTKELNNKKEEIKHLKLKLFDNKKYNENNIAINFMSNDQQIHYPIPCNENDSVVKLEEEVYNQYPQYKDYNTYLTVNGRLVKRFKTLKENGIKNSNAITVNIYEE